MRQVGIEYSEEGFAFGAVLPVGVPATLVPAWCVLVDIVVLLAVVGRVVAGLAQILRIDLHAPWQRHLAAHVLTTEGIGIGARDQDGAGRTAHSAIGVSMLVDHTFCCETIKRRGIWREDSRRDLSSRDCYPRW